MCQLVGSVMLKKITRSEKEMAQREYINRFTCKTDHYMNIKANGRSSRGRLDIGKAINTSISAL